MDDDKAASRIHPVILSGGSGTRLWPKSREDMPKQFLPFLGDQSLLQQTAERIRADGFAPPLIISNDSCRHAIVQQMSAIALPAAAVVLEPCRRNSAPAAATAALLIQRDDPAGLMLVLPSDHAIADPAAFHAAIATAAKAARAGHLVTFGIRPTRPETGYGYIHPAASPAEWQPIERFVEKPDIETARHYVESGEYLWNSGIFLFPVTLFLDELARHAPEMVAACAKALDGAESDGPFLRLEAGAFSRCPADSIDYAVMERTRHAVVVPVDMGWSDLGSWQSVWEQHDKDGDGNVLLGDVVATGVRDSLIESEGRLTAVLGLDNVVVVTCDDVVLVADRSQSQNVKTVVEHLKAAKRHEVQAPLTVARPWGTYTSIDTGPRFQVKRITVTPGSRLSLQMHHHRAEHWIVVHGTARVTRGSESFLLFENQSTFIPKGMVHRLENPGKVPLHLIEVQSGTYLGEDDIVRYSDDYGRDPAGAETMPTVLPIPAD